MIAAVTATIGSYAPITTVDIASRFLRPLGAKGGDVLVEILKPGRRLVVGRITINDRASGKLAADLSNVVLGVSKAQLRVRYPYHVWSRRVERRAVLSKLGK